MSGSEDRETHPDLSTMRVPPQEVMRLAELLAATTSEMRDPSAVPALAKALVTAEPLVRSHAAWALGRLGGPESEAALKSALAGEADGEVRAEIELAIADCPRTVPSR